MKNSYYIWNPLFLISLAVLLLNDFWWKESYPGLLTGKLSDVSGLVVFVLFFASWIQPRFRLLLFVLTALIFTWWKSSRSGPFIETWNHLFWFFPLERRIDYTDLFCLLILIPAYFYIPKRKPKSVSVSYFTYPLLFLGLFAITATSKAKNIGAYGETHRYWIDESFKLKMTKAEFIRTISLSNITMEKDPEASSVSQNGYSSYLLKNFTIHEFAIESMSIGLKEKGKKLIVYIGSVDLVNSTDKTIKTIRQEISSESRELFRPEY